MLYRFFTSVRLTIGLLLGLAAISVGGTIIPVEANRFEIFYQTPWYRILLLLLALNLIACTWKTIRRNIDDRGRFAGQIKAHPALAECLHLTAGPDVVRAQLKRGGFRMQAVEGGLLAVRGRLGRWGSTVVHLSLLVILTGGILSEFGFVGTLILPVGESTFTYYSWDANAERSLGFTVRLDAFDIEYYPIDVRFGVYEPQTREQLAEITTRTGETVALPLEGLSARVVHFEPFDQTLTLDILKGGEVIGTYRTPSNKEKEDRPNFLDPVALIRLVAFRDPIDKQYSSRVSILEQGEVVQSGLIEVNRPLVHRGVAIYQTAFNQDEFGFWYSGFQLSKDPGEPLVWVGSVLLIVGLFCAFAIRQRVLALVPVEQGVFVQLLSGFGDERGQRLLESLQQGAAEARQA